MNIMYITDVGFDTPNSNNILVLSMLKEFLLDGHNVYLVQSHSTGTYKDIPQELSDFATFKCDSVEKEVVGKTNFVKRYLVGLKYELNARKKWRKQIPDIDVVLLQSHYTVWFTAWLMRKYKAKKVFNIYDIFPGEAYVNGSIKSKFIYNCFSWLQNYLYRICNYFFVLSEDMRKTLMSKGVSSDKISIIPVWFDDKSIAEVPIDENQFAKKYNLSLSKKYIQYAGSIGVAYNFDFVVDVALKLQYRNDLIFQIVGEGLKLVKTIKRVKELNLTNVQFLPWQPLSVLSDVYSFCTLQIIPLMPEVIRNSFPSKILPLMACSRVPVISVEKDSSFYDEINNTKVGLTSPIGDVNAMAENILKLVDNSDLLMEYQRNAYKYVYSNFTAEINVNRMLNVFSSLQ